MDFAIAYDSEPKLKLKQIFFECFDQYFQYCFKSRPLYFKLINNVPSPTAAPFFTVEPEIQNKAEGETAEIKCEASGTPEPKITWIHNGKPIEQAEPNPRRQVCGPLD